MKLTPEIIKQNISFLDNIAIETMKVYTELKPPQSAKDSGVIARISYNQALEMLTERLKMIDRYELRQLEDSRTKDEEHL